MISIQVIPKYRGTYHHQIDNKSRFSVPSDFRSTLAERNIYNISGNDFEIMKDASGHVVLAFRRIPVASIESDTVVPKSDLDLSGIDRLVYIGTGTNEAGVDFRPVGESNAVMLFSFSDAMIHMYHPKLSGSNLPNHHRDTTIDSQGRVHLNTRERDIFTGNSVRIKGVPSLDYILVKPA